MTRGCFIVLALASLGACARPTPEQQIVEDAASALGGRDRLLAVKTIAIEGDGTQWNLGQDMTPGATGQTFSVTIRRAIDVAGGRARTGQTRTPNFLYFQGPAPQRVVSGVDGEVGYNVAPNGTASRASNAAARDRRAEIHHHPLTIVRAALDPASRLENVRTLANETALAITSGGLAFTLAIDSTTKLPTRVVSMTSNAVLGDVAIETVFADYQDVNGLKLPSRLTTKTDTYVTADLKVSKQSVDEAVDIAIPGGPPAAPATPPANVTVEELAKGVWLLAGQSHHSVVVEFADHLTLIEAPNEARTVAVIAKARELRPGKPLTHVVNSHHHFDHSGGIRTAVAEGLSVVTHKANAAFYEDLAGRSRTISPDALSKSPKPVKLEVVDDEKTFKDEAMTMQVLHIAGNPHGDAMLMVYLPRERLLVQADAFSPGGAYQPYAANLLENIQKRHLRVDRLVPIHGTVVPFAELEKSVKTQATN